jgi:aryl-alcohol dehydrogenase-like predicted oxidoreductase
MSEYIVGEWMAARGNRDDIVLATKYTSPWKIRRDAKYPGISVNYIGNSKKSLKLSLDDSLRKLKTDYLDILYVHWWDHTTDIPELMQSLNDVVRSGKVLYLGISDTPAWIVSAANEYARAHGMAQFVV